jgi:hypothetical protein
MQILHGDPTCRSHMQIPHVDPTCRPHIPHADPTCRSHMQIPHAEPRSHMQTLDGRLRPRFGLTSGHLRGQYYEGALLQLARDPPPRVWEDGRVGCVVTEHHAQQPPQQQPPQQPQQQSQQLQSLQQPLQPSLQQSTARSHAADAPNVSSWALFLQEAYAHCNMQQAALLCAPSGSVCGRAQSSRESRDHRRTG